MFLAHRGVELERGVRVGAALHVDPQIALDLLRGLRQPVEVRERDRGVDVEP